MTLGCAQRKSRMNSNDLPGPGRRALLAPLRLLEHLVGWLLALLILFEEWGWEPLQAALARLGAWLHLRRLEDVIRRLPPWAALALFVAAHAGAFAGEAGRALVDRARPGAGRWRRHRGGQACRHGRGGTPVHPDATVPDAPGLVRGPVRSLDGLESRAFDAGTRVLAVACRARAQAPGAPALAGLATRVGPGLSRLDLPEFSPDLIASSEPFPLGSTGFGSYFGFRSRRPRLSGRRCTARGPRRCPAGMAEA